MSGEIERELAGFFDALANDEAASFAERRDVGDFDVANARQRRRLAR